MHQFLKFKAQLLLYRSINNTVSPTVLTTRSNRPQFQPEQDIEYDFDASIAKGFTTASVPVTTASATPEVSTAAANLVYIRRSAEKRKDKGKAIMKEDEYVQKKTKKQLEQERLGHEEAIRLQEHINEEEN
ncbi:hypothetical protein Tco_1092451 [Tanacetum coccineum]|uniref:Uncharacterized protein n=1 Tax=Tanacetum coccineum TaxID=301880 RepID=A0ABQ5I9X4_9ASTR